MHVAKRSAEHEFTALRAAARADLDEVVRGAHHGLLVLDDEQRVALVAQALHHADEPSDVARMQADARFIEHEQRVHERCAEARGEIHALQLAAAERAGLPVEIQVAQAGALEIAEPRGDFGAQHLRGLVGLADVQRAHEGQQIAHRQLPEVVQRAALDAKVERRLLQASAVALVARRVGTVAAEEDAHVHLVGARFLPLEEAAHAIPLAVVVGFLGIAPVALDEPLAVLLAELVEGQIDVHPACPGALDEVVLAVAIGLAAEGFHEALADAEGFIGHRLGQIQPERPAEPAAGGTGSDGVVETEETGRGRGKPEVAVRAAPVGGEAEDLRFEI